MIEKGPKKNNAREAEGCCAKIYPDDGRQVDGEDHGGDWGSHSRADGYTDYVNSFPVMNEQPINDC